MTRRWAKPCQPYPGIGGPELNWQQRSVGPMDNNAYLLSSVDDHLILVDAADEAAMLLDWIGDRTVDAIITTHHHMDHLGALAQLVEATGAPAWCGAPDAGHIKELTGVHCRPVWTQDVIQLGDEGIEFIGLVGHTPGSIALLLPTAPTVILTGDCLFPGGIGRTDSPANFNSLFSDICTKIFDRFDDDTVVLPGHGKSTTIGQERPQLPQWRERGW